MTLKKLKRLTPLLFAFVLQGCAVAALCLEHGMNACNYQKDVSNDPRKAYLIGKQYVLKQDVSLYQCKETKELFLVDEFPIVNKADFIIDLGVVKRGTILTVTQVLVEANYLGGESCSHTIRARFENEEGQQIIADISLLFSSRHQFSDENALNPNSKLLEETFVQ